MRRTKCWISIAILCLFTTTSVFGADNTFNVCDYGAKPDGKTMCTKSIQKAIDVCAKQGGGTVYFPPGTFLSGTIYMKSNITLSNIEATGANPTGCAISGLPGHPIENLTISNVRLSFAGGGTKKDAARAIPEKPTAYPEYSMFGKLPAYGFYCRHVKGLKLRNIQLQLDKSDQRHALVAEDCESLSIDDLDAPFSQNAAAIIRLTDIKGTLIRGCRPPAGTDTFLKLQGSASKGVLLTANDLSRAGKVAVIAPNVPGTALSLLANQTAQKP